MCRMHAIGAVFLVAACQKAETAPAEPVASRDVPAPATSATSPMAAAAMATATASATASAAASSSAAPQPTTGAKPGAKADTEKASTLPASAGSVAGKNFVLYLASPGCHVDAACSATIKLVATGDYHVNKDYPYKLVPAAGFSLDAQDFKQDAEKEGTLTVRFTPKAKGETKVAGTFKLSVCSAENCQIEAQPIALAVAVQ